MNSLTVEQKSDVEEAWAKFAVLFRDGTNVEQTADAAARFVTRCKELGEDRIAHLGFTEKDLAMLGQSGMSMMAVAIADAVVKTFQVQVQLKTAVEGFIENLVGLFSKVQPPCDG